MRGLRLLTICGMVLAVASCDSSAGPDPSVPSFSASGQGHQSKVSAKGHGVFLLGGVTPTDFEFNAKQDDDRASGHFRFYTEDGGFIYDFDADVTCMTADAVNHRAWIAGVVKHNGSTDPAYQETIHQPGHDLWFRVLDNADKTSPGDRMTFVGFEGSAGVTTSAEYCERQLWRNEGQPVVEGKITVTP